ncbi:hypothetical protein QQX98_000402 [Neonectria punicea]|uniref:ZN622/Rei1/Reh1 zinc finger C2H2-type domain-containing protein n=1 Tax=Neonectria punicea TaxID=979145 RepID=A0ABR1HT82_9HYPO
MSQMASSSFNTRSDAMGTTALRESESAESAANAPTVSRHEEDDGNNVIDQPHDTDVNEEREFNPTHCLFCNRLSVGLTENLEHMRITHGLIIPAKDRLIVDVETLLGYMNLVIFGYLECLFCGRQRYTAQAAQQHMIGSSHCKLDHLSEDSEFRDFYDFGSDEADTDGDKNEHGNGNTDLNAHRLSTKTTTPQKVQPDGNVLRLPSGKLVSNKSFNSRRPHRHLEAPANNESRAKMGATLPANLESSSHNSKDTALTPANGSLVKSRSEKRGLALTGQLANLRAEDRRSLMHLPVSQQRALIATRQKQDQMARGRQQAMQRRVERSGNKTLMMHFVSDVPGRSNG